MYIFEVWEGDRRASGASSARKHTASKKMLIKKAYFHGLMVANEPLWQ